MKFRLLCLFLVVGVPAAHAQTTPNPVIHWAGVVQQSIHNAAAPRSPGTSEILHTLVHLSVYDAVVAIEGGSRPFAARIHAWSGANLDAAVATAAYVAARARVAEPQHAFLDQEYSRFLAGIPDGLGKWDGVRVGWQAAVTLLFLRAHDRLDNVVPYQCSAVPPPAGEFEPDTGCPAGPTAPQPVDTKVGQIRPYTFTSTRPFRPAPPVRLSSQTYVNDFLETRDYGRADSAARTAEETDIAFFWSEHPYVHWNRNLAALATSHNLNVRDTARLFAMAHTAVSDALVVGFEAKYRHTFWRPRTAIPRADADGNPDTDGDPTWQPLISVNHPEYPSGHAFWSGALLNAVSTFFGTDQVTWTIATSKAAVPRVEKTERTYTDLNVIALEIGNARVWAGLHWRQSLRDGAKIGERVAAHVLKHNFRTTR